MAGGFRSVLHWLGLSAAPSVVSTPPVPTPEYPPAESGWEFYLRHVGRDGTVKQSVLNPLWCIYTKAKYSGRLQFGLNAYADEVATFVKYDLVEVWVRNTKLKIMDTSVVGGRGFVMDERFIFMEGPRAMDDDGLIFWTGVCVSKWDVLGWRRVLWPTGQAGITKFEATEAETVGKELVRLNATADALSSSGRWRDGDLAGMGFTVTIATDQARGSQIERTTNGGRLDSILEDVAAGSGGDFALTWTDLTDLTLDYNEGQQGQDKYGSVIFSTEKRNMARPRTLARVIGAATVVVVAGQGRDDARLYTPGGVQGDDYAADNDIELYVDARDLNTDAGLEARGRQKLQQQAASEDIAFEVIQTSDTFYSPVAVNGRNTYDVGDRCRAEFFGTFDRQITAVTVEWTSEVPQISIEHGGYVPMSPQDEVIDTIIEKVKAVAAAVDDLKARPNENKHLYLAASDPTSADDLSAGYNVGSEIVTAAGAIWKCKDATVGSAQWDQLN